MKFDFMREEETLIPCRIVYKGKERDLLLHHLTDADEDAADRKFPIPVAPFLLDDAGKKLREPNGRPILDTQDPKYLAATVERWTMRTAFLAVLALGADKFEAQEIDAQIAELRRSGDGFSWTAIKAIAEAATKASQMTPAVQEAAEKRVAPFASLAADEASAT